MDPFTAFGALGTVLIAVKQWSEQVLKIDQEFREDVREAAQKILAALNQTETYLKSGDNSLEAESSLSQAWQLASAALYGVNTQLSQLCYLKGEHWKDPSKLSDSEITQAGISIEQIKIAVEKLLFDDQPN